MTILIINGPNLNMLGVREKNVYGTTSLIDINNDVEKFAKGENVEVEFFQSNSEGEIIDIIQSTYVDGIILNAGAYSHYSYAIRDAIKTREIPIIEVHMSNIYARDEFRHKSVLSEVCVGVICGFGANVYKLALQAFISGDYIEE